MELKAQTHYQYGIETHNPVEQDIPSHTLATHLDSGIYRPFPLRNSLGIPGGHALLIGFGMLRARALGTCFEGLRRPGLDWKAPHTLEENSLSV